MLKLYTPAHTWRPLHNSEKGYQRRPWKGVVRFICIYSNLDPISKFRRFRTWRDKVNNATRNRSRMWGTYKTTGLIANKSQSLTKREGGWL